VGTLRLGRKDEVEKGQTISTMRRRGLSSRRTVLAAGEISETL